MRDTEKTKNVPEPSQAKEQFGIGAKVSSYPLVIEKVTFLFLAIEIQ